MHLHPYRPNLPNFHLIKSQLKRRLKALGLSVLPPLIDPNLLNCFKSTWKNFSFSELQAATDNLSHENLIGVGGYSEVSWGCSRMIRATPINKEEDYISELGGQKEKLAWCLRFKIALGVASGNSYLHEGCERRTIHRGIKSDNVLLAEDFQPKVIRLKHAPR
ncbi:receptor-like cytosolic serine threonine- kinase RBK2 [Olea europaea subsp. europaea]|uniref:Receptor-like cytosolic serine threonine- kinase RBK2 n=1 Tax=Olea europaea subsp. europaea TaxID=158383 RepID=A0A8S0UWG8_OLEEU|nr:receptor-like cytosolic serine threonine- kinase RBK2 [Olea europaea subsp. europaea]